MRIHSAFILSLIAIGLAACGKGPSGPVQLTYFAGRDFWVVIFDKAQLKTADDFIPFARDICKDKDPCQVGFWFERRLAPNLIPMDYDQARAEAFNYGKNTASNYEGLNWNCQMFPAKKDAGCIPMPLNP